MEVLLLAAAIAADEEDEVDDAVSVVLSVCMVNDAEEGSNIDTLLLLLLLLLVVLFSHVDSIFLLLRFISFRLPLAVSSGGWMRHGCLVVDLLRKTGEELW